MHGLPETRILERIIKVSQSYRRLFARACLSLCLSLCLGLSGCVSNVSYTDDNQDRSILFTVSREPDRNDFPGLALSGYAGSGVRFGKMNLSEELINGILRLHNLRKVSQFPIESLNVEAVVAEFEKTDTRENVIQGLSLDKRVNSVQTIQSYKLLSYNDPYFSLQNTVNGDLIENVHAITTGKNVTVGIVDTGVDRLHPELIDAITYSKNFVDSDEAAFDRDEHGTAVAGVIGSAANNDLGIVGVAPDVKLMIFKACRQEVGSRRTSCNSVSIIKALNDVLHQHPEILNLSLAGPSDPMIRELLQRAAKQGIVIIAAVDESRGEARSFPANMPEVIAVGTSISYGTDISDMVLAPGIDMLTTAPGATYGFKTGSSMATAYVSGIAALMKEQVPALDSYQIYNYLRDSSRFDENTAPVVDMCMAIFDAGNHVQDACVDARRMAGVIGTSETVN